MTQKETAQERLEKMKRQKEEATAKAAAEKKNTTTELVGQLTHEKDGTPDLSEVAAKLEAIKKETAKGENEGHVKMTIYVEQSVARSFNALVVKRGDQKKYVNQALRDFVQKKAKELGL